MDSDEPSIAYAARIHSRANARYVREADGAVPGRFDLVIASEVIEHVDDPDAFLDALTARLHPGGKVVLTLPNGYGPFELAALIESLTRATGLYGLLRGLRRRLRAAPAEAATTDTLAWSPHVNFFSYGLIREVIACRGYAILEYRPRTFLCGFGFDQLLRSPAIIAWNAAVADRLPPQLVSDWMFLLEPSRAPLRAAYRRGAYARARRYLNERPRARA
jgi:SAM-dependent methyltransferase